MTVVIVIYISIIYYTKVVFINIFRGTFLYVRVHACTCISKIVDMVLNNGTINLIQNRYLNIIKCFYKVCTKYFYGFINILNIE